MKKTRWPHICDPIISSFATMRPTMFLLTDLVEANKVRDSVAHNVRCNGQEEAVAAYGNSEMTYSLVAIAK